MNKPTKYLYNMSMQHGLPCQRKLGTSSNWISAMRMLFSEVISDNGIQGRLEVGGYGAAWSNVPRDIQMLEAMKHG